ncbi:PDDEXK nuclease domain-containing protein [Shewanella surugensis]|uniref:PDDEXK nuclease domain-containing protein n=1 Tax=Shewanella surugensis TaxID=212020 RepID=A0ABT0L6R2_9GAMM|nr:PDDEXK nuclease domain-containing protein [Shewanella surugensis]MCL1123391.1 PDDEXK nuclease domain-containing protein [Shewanella surugensis]
MPSEKTWRHWAMGSRGQEINTQAIFTDIKRVIEQARTQVKQSVNHAMVTAYWQIGRLIIEDEQQGKVRAQYGKAQLTQLSEKLTKVLGKGFSVRNLRNMRAFFVAFPNRQTLSTKLSWSHYNKLLSIESEQARLWYMQESAQQNWSVRALERQIGTLYYERLLSSRDKIPVEQEATEKTAPLAETAEDYLRDPYILDFLNLDSGHYQESDLEQGIINNLQKFLLELGKGFAFVDRQQRIITDDGDYFIDLVFYNYHLKCFVLIDLKLNKLSHQDVGQMDMYVRMYEQHKRQTTDNPTIGLILCSETNNTVVKYSVLNESKQLFASQYITHLPTEEELCIELQKERERVQQQLKNAAKVAGERHE